MNQYREKSVLKAWHKKATKLHETAQDLFCSTMEKAEGDDGLTDASDDVVDKLQDLIEIIERRLGVFGVAK